MDSVQKLIQALATLLWPLIVILVILEFRPALMAIIASAKSRGFTLKIGGQELTMAEANEVQQKLIADLQNQVSEIQKRLPTALRASAAVGASSSGIVTEDIPGMPAPMPARTAPSPSAPGAARPDVPMRPAGAAPAVAAALPRPLKLLWVDDHPKNNSYFIQQLGDAGVKVDLAESTSEGASRLGADKYDYVISDMGRSEDGHFNATAGLDFLRIVRKADARVPFVIYCSSQAVRDYGKQALELGASAVTSSPTELFGILNPTAARPVS